MFLVAVNLKLLFKSKIFLLGSQQRVGHTHLATLSLIIT